MGVSTCPSAELCRYRRCSLLFGVRCGLALPRFLLRELPDVTSPETVGVMADGCAPLGCSALAAATATATPQQPSRGARGARGAPSLSQFHLAATRVCGASTTCLASWRCVRAALAAQADLYASPAAALTSTSAVAPAQGTTGASAGSAGDNTRVEYHVCKRPRTEEVGAACLCPSRSSGG